MVDRALLAKLKYPFITNTPFPYRPSESYGKGRFIDSVHSVLLIFPTSSHIRDYQ